MTLDSLGGTATTLTYNAADRLVRVSAGGVPLVDYVYAATGQRAVKATPTATTHYLYDPGGALYAETDGAGTVLREYITLGGATIAIVDAGGMAFVHNDHLATPQVMTDGAAAVVWDASYRPFGEATIAGAAANNQRFPGQTADAETGYSDNWYRTYDPSLGRYLQSDPIGLMAGFNTYGYVGGNPVMYMDPMGLNYGGAAIVGAVAVAVGVVASNMGAMGVAVTGGFIVGAGSDILIQMAMNGGRIRCVSWSDVLISGSIGAAGGGLGFIATGIRWAKRGSEFSHWIPDRYFRVLSRSGQNLNKYYKKFLDNRLGQWFRNSPLNGNFVPREFHWATDNFRQLARSATKDMSRYNRVVQQIFRIPAWIGGSFAGGIGGAAATASECECE